MRNDQLKKLIEELNLNPSSPKFLITKISKNVFWGKVWQNLPWSETSSQYFGENFYFIRIWNSLFVGVVEASVSEMHVFLEPEFRDKGVMSKTLREVIIPHMFYISDSNQLKITIDADFHGEKFEKVERSAQLAGFKSKKEVGDKIFEYKACKNDFRDFHFSGEKEQLNNENEFSFLHERINSINAQLQYMKERFEILFEKDEKFISDIKNAIGRFEYEYDNRLRSQFLF